ncbi:IS1 transposase [[Leptolyngbya] sp. PCC 7376]|nr:IS1 transposase [[Leptolyngbya] sp. PCC 7376]
MKYPACLSERNYQNICCLGKQNYICVDCSSQFVAYPKAYQDYSDEMCRHIYAKNVSIRA